MSSLADTSSLDDTENQNDQNDPIEVDTIETDQEQDQEQEQNDTNETNPTEIDMDSVVQLGDTIRILSTEKGEISGIVYYRSAYRISIKPFGTSTMLISFDIDDEEYTEDVTEINIIKKHTSESFVEQQQFETDQRIDTITSTQEKVGSYIIKEVNRDSDFIIIQRVDANQPEEKDESSEPSETIEFEYTGIPIDREFALIVIRSSEESHVLQSNNDADLVTPSTEYDEFEADQADDEMEIEIIATIEITLPKEYREAQAYEQFIPDHLQKIDAMNDLMSEVHPRQQNDPIILRKNRIMVETLYYLKQATVSYHEDGTRKGIRAVSATMLDDLIGSVTVPLGRPVLGAIKKEYTLDDEMDIHDDVITSVPFNDELDEMKDMIESIPPTDSIEEWRTLRTFLTDYLSPWTPAVDTTLSWTPVTDTDFFREDAPILTDGIFEKNVPGYIPGARSEETQKIIGPPVFNRVSFGLERSLTTTFRKGKNTSKDNSDSKEILLSAEHAPIRNYLLFPLEAAPHMGVVRTYHLATDSGASQLPRTTMKTLLRTLGTPVEVGTSNTIKLLRPSEETIGNIPLADYIEGIRTYGLSIHDMYYILLQLGIDNMELSIPLYNVLAAKIDHRQRQLLSTLAVLREKMTSHLEQSVPPAPNQFIDPLPFMDKLKKQDVLSDEIAKYIQTNISLGTSDVGILGWITKKYSNYVQVTAGGDPLLVSHAMSNAVRNNYLEIERIKKAREQNKADPMPIQNRCKHVATLAAIRKKRDDTERFRDLTAFFKRFQGSRDQNWINCTDCKQHLLCTHERLQIEGFLQPAEKPSINKDIIMNFSGGQFQGQYICRNCGQPIRDFEFDNTVEFDDNGRPKSGHAVLVDNDEEEENELDEMVTSAMKYNTNELKINDRDILYYSIIREMAQYMDIGFTNNQIYNMLQHINDYMTSRVVDTKEKYQILTAKNSEKISYDTYRAKHSIGITIAFLLIEIQCAIPPYLKRYRYNDKIYTLDGYPLDTDKTKVSTIQYICISLYYRFKRREAEYPWNSADIFASPDINVCLPKILKLITPAIRYVLEVEVVKDALQRKRRRRETTTTVIEQLPLAFLPEQTTSTEVLVPEVAAANNAKSRLALIMYWIYVAHTTAKEHAMTIHMSPFSETTCCRRNITTPGLLIEQVPDIGIRSLAPKQIHMLLTEFVPRVSPNDLVAADPELFYRLFLSCCFKGDHIGYPHELSITNQCMWCEIQFAEHPQVMDAAEQKAALAGEEITTESFTELLNTVHRLHMVETILPYQVKDQQQIIGQLADVPFKQPTTSDWNDVTSWNDVIDHTFTLFMKLPPDTTMDDVRIIEATSVISPLYDKYDKRVRPYYKKQEKIIDDIIALPWNVFCDVLQAYFVIPFQRKLTNFSEKSLRVTSEMEKSLSKQHVENDIKKEILEPELKFYVSFQIEERLKTKVADHSLHKNDIAKKYKVILQTMKEFIEQVSALVSYKNKIRLRNVPVKDLLLSYIKKLILMGSLHILILKDDRDSSAVLRDLVMNRLDKYYTERLSFDPEVLKNRIQSKNEQEKALIIAELDDLRENNTDLFQIEKMKKRLGMGKWAVGGTKLIYAYDKDYYDRERERRLDSGIIDFPGLTNEDPQQGRQVDAMGFAVEGEQEGYDHAQHGDDDYDQ